MLFWSLKSDYLCVWKSSAWLCCENKKKLHRKSLEPIPETLFENYHNPHCHKPLHVCSKLQDSGLLPKLLSHFAMRAVFTWMFIVWHHFNFAKLETKAKAMFTLYRKGLCSISKVAPVQCEQELMFNMQLSLLIWKDYLPKRGFCFAISAPIKVFSSVQFNFISSLCGLNKKKIQRLRYRVQIHC